MSYCHQDIIRMNDPRVVIPEWMKSNAQTPLKNVITGVFWELEDMETQNLRT